MISIYRGTWVLTSDAGYAGIMQSCIFSVPEKIWIRKRTKYEKENLLILNISSSQGKINVLGLAKDKEKSYLFL